MVYCYRLENMTLEGELQTVSSKLLSDDSSNSCTKVGNVFSEAVILGESQEEEEEQRIEDVFVCVICGQTLSSLRHLCSHNFTTHGTYEFACSFCEENCDNFLEFASHWYRRHTCTPGSFTPCIFRCHCGAEFENRSIYDKHLFSHDNQHCPVPGCHQSLITQRGMRQHLLQQHHPTLQSLGAEANEYFRCKFCKILTISLKEWHSHNFYQHLIKRSECPVCGQPVKEWKALKRHWYNCGCAEYATSNGILNQNQLLNIAGAASHSGFSAEVVPIDELELIHLAAASSHACATTIVDQQLEQAEEQGTTRRSKRIRSATAAFRNPLSLTDSLSIRPTPLRSRFGGPESYPCPKCSESFIGFQELYDHGRQKHGNKVTSCPSCYYQWRKGFGPTIPVHWDRTHRFKTLSAASVIYAADRDGAMPYFSCDVQNCRQTFRTVEQLERHAVTHDGAVIPTNEFASRSFVCDVCGLVLNTAKALYNHKRTCYIPSAVTLPEIEASNKQSDDASEVSVNSVSTVPEPEPRAEDASSTDSNDSKQNVKEGSSSSAEDVLAASNIQLTSASHRFTYEATFPSLEEAEEAIKYEGTWTVESVKRSTEGRKTYYRCIMSQKEGIMCQSRLYVLHNDSGHEFSIHRSTQDHVGHDPIMEPDTTDGLTESDS